MYEELLEYLKEYLEKNVNAIPVQVDYYGNMPVINLAKPAIAIEPLEEIPEDESSRWIKSTFSIKLWILVQFDLSYLKAFGDSQKLLTANDDTGQVFGIQAALQKMKRDDAFLALEGSMAGKRWRIHAEALDLGRTRFGVTMRSGVKVHTTTQELRLYIQRER
jgi:hypothetical protein